eukprot:UN26220
MSALEIIESTFKTLHKRTDDAFEGVQMVNKQHAKTTTGMNNVVDTIREMREKVRSLMSLQDDIQHQFKNVDKIILGNAAGDYDLEPVKRVKKEVKKPSYDDEEEYTPKASSRVQFDEPEPVKEPEPEPEPEPEVEDEPEPEPEEEPASEEPAAEEEAAPEEAPDAKKTIRRRRSRS